MTDMENKMIDIAMWVLSENCNIHPCCRGCQFNVSEDYLICLLREVFPGNWLKAATWEEEHSCKSTSEE